MMIDRLAVFNGSSVNRYGMVFTIGALESGLDQSWKLGMPSFLSHDYHRPIAWSRGLCLYFEPGLVRLVGITSIPESKEDMEDIERAISYYFDQFVLSHFEPHRERITQILSTFLTEQAREWVPDCAAFIDPDLARRAFPEVFSMEDKDGLVPIMSLNPVAPGIYEKKGLLLFAHQYFRRSHSRINTLNVAFLQRLQGLSSNKEGLDIRIALDTDMIGLAETLQEHIELEYWWGPEFNDDLDTIPKGVTTHTSNDTQRIFHGISRTEFWWYLQDERHTFECEELRDIPSYGIDAAKYGCRFVHCMLDPEEHYPSHFDGALRIYDEESMLNRMDVDIKTAGRNASYVKLWRVDGELSVIEWKELLTHYYRDNSLVGEYLGAIEDPAIVNPQQIIAKERLSLSEYVAYDMQPGDGLRISVSYHAKPESQLYGRSIVALDTLTIGSKLYRYVEADTSELIKMCRKGSHNINIPKDISYIAFEDQVVNLPLINHRGVNSIDLAMKTLVMIMQLCQAWEGRGDNRLLSFNIGIEYDDRDVYFSFAGHIHDLNRWYSNYAPSFPISMFDMGEWCSQIHTFLSDNFNESKNHPSIDEILQKSGILLFRRRFLDPEQYRVYWDTKNKQPKLDLLIPKELLTVMNQRELNVAFAFLIMESLCTKCHQAYRECNCLRYLNNDVVEKATSTICAGLFWTNRKA